MGAVGFSSPSRWGSLPIPPLLRGASPMQGCLIKCAIIKGLTTDNADDSKVSVTLFAQGLIRSQGAINALNAVHIPL